MKKSNESNSGSKNNFIPFPAIANYTNNSAHADGTQMVRATTKLTSSDLPNNTSYYKTNVTGQSFKYDSITTTGTGQLTLQTFKLRFRRQYVFTVDCDANGGHFITASNSNQTENLVFGDAAGENGVAYGTTN